jgi:hypothetical protein
MDKTAQQEGHREEKLPVWKIHCMHIYSFLHEKSVAYRRHANIVSVTRVDMLSVEMEAECN